MKTTHLNIQFSSQKQIIFILFFVFCVAVFIICTLMYKVFSDKLADDLYTRSIEVIDVIDYMAQTSGNSPALVKGVKTLGANRDIKLIVIRIDEPPKIIASNKHVLIGHQTNEIFSSSEGVRSFQFDAKTDQYTAVSSVWLENKLNNSRLTKASVGIIFDTSKIRLHLQEQILNTSFALILTMICVLCIVYFLTRKYIFKPLEVINNSLINNKKDNEYSPIPLIFEGEIGAVAKTLNQLFTDLYQSKLTLREQKERYDLALHGVKAGLVDWDIITNTMYCSSSLMKILGIVPEDFTPSMEWIENRIHDDDKELARAALISHLKFNTEYDVEGRLRHEDGSFVWIRARGQAIRDESGKAIRMVGYFVDISKRKAHEYFMYSFYNLSSDATTPLKFKLNNILKETLSYLDLAGGIICKIEDEKYFVEYLQCPDEYQINDTSVFNLKDTLCSYTIKENDIVAIYNIANSKLKNSPAHTIAGINTYIAMPLYVHGKIRGTVNFFDKRIKQRPFEEREKSFIRLIAQWIGNELMRAEYIDYLHKTENRLADAVNELTKTNAELENFVYVASHDLQEPLRMITNFTDLLEKHYGDQLDDTAKEYLNILFSSSTQMRQLIKGLLDYARARREKEKTERIDIYEIINHVYKNLEKQIKESNAKITFDKLPVIDANKASMISLLQNLVNNAIKFQPENNQPVIEINVSEQFNGWEIAVKDNGIGVDSVYFSKIFEPFKRLHANNEYIGSGIGLAVCKKIVDRMGGDIWVESDGSSGSIFYITVPKLMTQTGKAA